MPDIKDMKDYLFTSLKNCNPVNYMSIEYGEQEIDIESSDSSYCFTITVNVYERPKIWCTRKAVYWPVDDAAPAEYKISDDEVEFDIKKIEVFLYGDLICENLYPYLNKEEIENIKKEFYFDEWEWGDDEDYRDYDDED